ncbi:TPA: hypothetical protein P3M14_005530 [Klebsiella pneumoniae]|uniref:hypothetical protein n=1 Tax=Klebsiella pneumoniae TaxID=573 RepID=UPI002DB9375F|nr:hypothetical protein [Klebsiella pneumoniae]MEC4387555.1 hypothetical protein [Klebsiella pneumoniae]HDO6789543.1 hypothetical protein [Klebsiella pneumoniae]
MHHVAEHPEEEIRAIELYTLLGREGVQVRLNSLSVKAALLQIVGGDKLIIPFC